MTTGLRLIFYFLLRAFTAPGDRGSDYFPLRKIIRTWSIETVDGSSGDWGAVSFLRLRDFFSITIKP
jgi:hypothetical protein